MNSFQLRKQYNHSKQTKNVNSEQKGKKPSTSLAIIEIHSKTTLK